MKIKFLVQIILWKNVKFGSGKNCPINTIQRLQNEFCCLNLAQGSRTSSNFLSLWLYIPNSNGWCWQDWSQRCPHCATAEFIHLKIGCSCTNKEQLYVGVYGICNITYFVFWYSWYFGWPRILNLGSCVCILAYFVYLHHRQIIVCW